MSLTKLGIIKLFLSRESLISDIPAGDGKMANLFYSVGPLQIFSSCSDFGFDFAVTFIINDTGSC
jgi:hypothetical protein